MAAAGSAPTGGQTLPQLTLTFPLSLMKTALLQMSKGWKFPECSGASFLQNVHGSVALLWGRSSRPSCGVAPVGSLLWGRSCGVAPRGPPVGSLLAALLWGGESLGGVLQASGRQLQAEEGLFMAEPDRASLHDIGVDRSRSGVEAECRRPFIHIEKAFNKFNAEEQNATAWLLTSRFLSGSGGHSAHMTSYSDSGYQDSSVSYYSSQNVVRSEPRASASRSPRAEGQASGQVGGASPFNPSTCSDWHV
ncbi:hypothetical protein EYF80_065777 [Liparis tanakae]|uniref:Uncharacterized protein n=1 Tax=Liparis tanakae TaxID=230148 RepID=A0A4Z2E679_9TELE|nr:hypothetical protein EYF80_065777 [Liparis tanakae]